MVWLAMDGAGLEFVRSSHTWPTTEAYAHTVCDIEQESWLTYRPLQKFHHDSSCLLHINHLLAKVLAFTCERVFME